MFMQFLYDTIVVMCIFFSSGLSMSLVYESIDITFSSKNPNKYDEV